MALNQARDNGRFTVGRGKPTTLGRNELYMDLETKQLWVDHKGTVRRYGTFDSGSTETYARQFAYTATLDATAATTWVTVKTGFGGKSAALIYGRIGTTECVAIALLAHEGTTGLGSDQTLSDSVVTGRNLEFRISSEDLQVRADVAGDEGETVYISGLKFGVDE